MVDNTVNCELVWREISNYLEEELDAALRAAMDEHFRGCQPCTSVLEGTRNVIALYGDERMMEVPAGFNRRLEKALAQNARASRRPWSTWSAWLVPVAALALIAGSIKLANSLTLTPTLKSEHAQPGQNIPPDLPVVVTAGANLFHVAGCEFIHNKTTEKTVTAKQAMRDGYVPCSRCLHQYLQTAHRLGRDSELTEKQVVEAEDLHDAGR